MEIKFYTAQMINPLHDKGDVEIKDAPLFKGASAPANGLLGYHKSHSLSLAMRSLIHEAVKKGSVLATIEVSVANLKKEDPKGSSINVASLKPDEVKHCEVMHLGRVSAPLRQKIIDILKDHAVTAEQKVKLANITNDRPFLEYLKMYPSSMDVLHAHPEFSHMKVIVYPTAYYDSVTGKESTEFMVALYEASPQDVSVKPIMALKDVNFVIPADILKVEQSLSSVRDQTATLKAATP